MARRTNEAPTTGNSRTFHAPSSTAMPTTPIPNPTICKRVARSAGISSATNSAVHSGVAAFTRLARMDVMCCCAMGKSTKGAPERQSPTTSSIPAWRHVSWGQVRMAAHSATSTRAPTTKRPTPTWLGENARNPSSINMKEEPHATAAIIRAGNHARAGASVNVHFSGFRHADAPSSLSMAALASGPPKP